MEVLDKMNIQFLDDIKYMKKKRSKSAVHIVSERDTDLYEIVSTHFIDRGQEYVETPTGKYPLPDKPNHINIHDQFDYYLDSGSGDPVSFKKIKTDIDIPPGVLKQMTEKTFWSSLMKIFGEGRTIQDMRLLLAMTLGSGVALGAFLMLGITAYMGPGGI